LQVWQPVFLRTQIDQPRIAHVAWMLATISPMRLAASIVHALPFRTCRRRYGGFWSMASALLLVESLAGSLVALMYSGKNVLADFAVFRSEHDVA